MNKLKIQISSGDEGDKGKMKISNDDDGKIVISGDENDEGDDDENSSDHEEIIKTDIDTINACTTNIDTTKLDVLGNGVEGTVYSLLKSACVTYRSCISVSLAFNHIISPVRRNIGYHILVH